MCDTFIALPSATADGSIIFGKNSDREPNEAQALEYYPAQTYPDGDTLQCTYMEIPQVKETHAVLLSRPFWMWGAEMGANEKGVVIGNEAVWTKMPMARKGGLTGMDLLRLALERSATAADALETMVQMLSDHGQGGICGYEDRRMVYHNSFIVADPGEAWVLETAGPLWAALKVKDVYTISNGLTLGEEFDQCRPDLIATARKKGLLKKGETFHFARCFSDRLFTTFSACRRRRKRSLSLVADKKSELDVPSAIKVLRDHQVANYRPDSHILANCLCAHAANPLTRNATQSTGSLVAHLRKETQIHWVTGTSAPCIGIFKPVTFEKEVLPDIGPVPDSSFNPFTLWWYHEMLHRLVLLDYKARLEAFRGERDSLEHSFIKQAYDLATNSRWSLTKMSFQRALEATGRWIERVQNLPIQQRTKWIYRRYWKKQNDKSTITL
jgi:secernin